MCDTYVEVYMDKNEIHYQSSLYVRSLTGILIRQVFSRCVIVWVRQGGLSCIPHLPYPGEDLGGRFQKDVFTFQKNLGKRRGTTLCDRVLTTR